MVSYARGAVTNLIDVAAQQAERIGDKIFSRFLVTGEVDGPVETLTFAELYRRARAIGAELQGRGALGERALVLCAPGLDFVIGFYAALLGGAIAVPMFPPDPTQPDRMLARLRHVARDARPKFLLTTSMIAELARPVIAGDPAFAGMTCVAMDGVDLDAAGAWTRPPVDGDSLALLQYTSGSTSEPRGVMVSHANLLHNQDAIHRVYGGSEEASWHTVGWLPLHHDMGLMGGVVQPMRLGFTCTSMSPLAFLERPMRWLEAISRLRGTLTGAPNFAYKLVARKATDRDRAALDLSSLTVASNGAEPINPADIECFLETFRPCGLRPESLFPSYGLAESTLLVTTVARAAGTSSVWVSKDSLLAGRAMPVESGAAGGTRLASCGRPAPGYELLVVDPETRRRRAPGEVGEIWLAGPSITRGYWGRPEETEQTFRARLAGEDEGRYLRTGDLGFVKDGELYVTGRIKDVIIVRGDNHYPQDIELTVARCHPAIRPGCVAAFSIEPLADEGLAVVAEARSGRAASAADAEDIVAAVRDAVVREHGVRVHGVLLLEPRTIPKTTSGKLQRYACRAVFADGATAGVLHRWVEPRSSGAPPHAQANGDRGAAAALDAGAAPRSARAEPMDARHLVAALTARLAHALGRPVEAIDPRASLSALGLDSILKVELRSALGVELGHDVPLELFSEDASIARIVEAVAAEPARPVAAGAPATVDGPRPRRIVERMRQTLDRIGRIRAAGLSYFERPVSSLEGQWVQCADGKRQIIFATYNYLGLLRHPRIEAAAAEATARYGTGTHGVRLLGGSLDLHQRLEHKIADFVGREAAITFTSGFMTNYTTITTLVGPGDWVIADQLNHASIVDGCAASGATFRVFRHRDLGGLESLLQEAPSEATVLVVADAVFSLDGDVLDLPRVAALCRRHGALLMVDEAHSIGVLGATGRGIEEHFGLPDVIDVKMGTLSKTIPAAGGYIAGNRALVDFLRASARGYVFSAAMPPPVAAAALAAIEVMEDEAVPRLAALWRNSNDLLHALRAAGFDTGASCSPIIPIIVGSDERALELTRFCQERGMFVLPALPPAVPQGTARLRLNVTAAHTLDDIRYALDVLTASRAEILHADARPTPAVPPG